MLRRLVMAGTPTELWISSILDEIIGTLIRIETKLDTILGQEVTIMAELDDLKAAVASTVALVTEATTDIDAAIMKLAAMVTTGVDPVMVEAQAQAIATANSSMKAELMKLEATLNPPAASPATPPPASPAPAA